MTTITVYTDGASRGNPGPGGWAAVLLNGSEVTELAGRATTATNNQMELEAVINALDYIQKNTPSAHVLLHADSTYVLKGLESWVDKWESNGWQTMAKKPVENQAQWKKLKILRDAFGKHLELIKVGGHTGELYNDRCDELAVAYALGKKPNLFYGGAHDYQQQLAATPPKSTKKVSNKKGSAKAYSYVSLANGKVHTDTTWAACEKRVKGVKGAKYKKVYSKTEETALIQDYTLETLL